MPLSATITLPGTVMVVEYGFFAVSLLSRDWISLKGDAVQYMRTYTVFAVYTHAVFFYTMISSNFTPASPTVCPIPTIPSTDDRSTLVE